MIEAVINVSEGQRREVISLIGRAAGDLLLDVHSDPHHNRSVYTLYGTADAVVDASLALARQAVTLVDLARHEGVHPRLGVVDVVPFVPYGSPFAMALEARLRFAVAFASAGVPCFYYGPERALPEVRRQAWRTLAPDVGPPAPHPSAGAACVGAREVLVAYNLVVEASPERARDIAHAMRGPAVRALGLRAGEDVQVSMNLVDPYRVGPATVFDEVAALAPIRSAELVGLVPAAVRDQIPRQRWEELGLAGEVTVEERAGVLG